MSDWTPLTPQEIYQKSLDEAQGEDLVPETRIEYFLNKIATGGGGGNSPITVIPVEVDGSENTVTSEYTYSDIAEMLSNNEICVVACSYLNVSGYTYYYLEVYDDNMGLVEFMTNLTVRQEDNSTTISYGLLTVEEEFGWSYEPREYTINASDSGGGGGEPTIG